MKYLMLVLCLFLISCDENAPYKTNRKYVPMVDKIQREYINSMEKEGFSLAASGGGMVGDIQRLTVGFCAPFTLDFEQTRALFVVKVEEFLAMLNGNRELRPYLHEYPFPTERLTFGIAFQTPKGFIVEAPNIAHISMMGDQIHYCVSKDGRSVDYHPIHIETYNEAYKIVYGVDRK
ncbi:MAG: hypothetical protein ACXU9U_01055 [Parachlamydiaceae bacterium]